MIGGNARCSCNERAKHKFLTARREAGVLWQEIQFAHLWRYTGQPRPACLLRYLGANRHCRRGRVGVDSAGSAGLGMSTDGGIGTPFSASFPRNLRLLRMDIPFPRSYRPRINSWNRQSRQEEQDADDEIIRISATIASRDAARQLGICAASCAEWRTSGRGA